MTSFDEISTGDDRPAMNVSQLLNRRVFVPGNLEVGRVVDVILEPDAERPLGLEVLCGDGGHRFAPASALRVEDDGVHLASALTLLERPELDFYLARGRSLRRSDTAA